MHGVLCLFASARAAAAVCLFVCFCLCLLLFFARLYRACFEHLQRELSAFVFFLYPFISSSGRPRKEMLCMHYCMHPCMHAIMHAEHLHACTLACMQGCMDGWMDAYVVADEFMMTMMLFLRHLSVFLNYISALSLLQ